MDNSQEKFFSALEMLADLCNMKLNPLIIGAFDDILAPYGYERLCSAARIIAKDIAINPRRLTPQMFLDALGEKTPLSDEDKARDAATRIIEAVTRYGWPNPQRAKEYVGQIGWDVVNQQGGWEELCNSLTTNNKGMMQAQWRELALTLIRKEKSGQLQIAPNYDDKRAQLPDNVMKFIDEAKK